MRLITYTLDAEAKAIIALADWQEIQLEVTVNPVSVLQTTQGKITPTIFVGDGTCLQGYKALFYYLEQKGLFQI